MLNQHSPRSSFLRKSLGFSRHVLLTSLLVVGVSQAIACDKPSFSAAIPNGSSATEAEMATVQVAIKNFVTANEAFIACVEGTSNAKKERNDAIDEMEKVAAAFNRELRIYRRNAK